MQNEKQKEKASMEWFKRHVDTVVVLGGILGAMMWMNGKFNTLEKEIAIMRTVLITKGIMSSELASNKGEMK